MTDSPHAPELRASDVDREAVATRLRAAAADGRLDMHEAEQRLSAAYGAKTWGELDPLTADLGADPPAVAGARRPGRLRMFREWAGVAIILNAIWAITSIAAGELVFYWPMFPLGIWGAVIVSQLLFGDGDRDDRGHRRTESGGRLPPPDAPQPPR